MKAPQISIAIAALASLIAIGTAEADGLPPTIGTINPNVISVDPVSDIVLLPLFVDCRMGGGDVAASVVLRNQSVLALAAGTQLAWSTSHGAQGIAQVGPNGLAPGEALVVGTDRPSFTCSAEIL